MNKKQVAVCFVLLSILQFLSFILFDGFVSNEVTIEWVMFFIKPYIMGVLSCLAVVVVWYLLRDRKKNYVQTTLNF
jgi:H+/gluconate symporter-like permease